MPHRHDDLHGFAATIAGASGAPPPVPASDRVKHAAAIAIRHFTTPLITLDDVIHVEDSIGHDTGSVTVRETLEWARTPQGNAVLAEEPFGFREQFLDFAARMLDQDERTG